MRRRTALAAERARARTLASQAANLKDLLARMENEVAVGAEKRGSGAQGGGGPGEAFSGGGGRSQGAFRQRAVASDPASLAPAIAFIDATGLLALPASGKVIKSFGAPSDFGGVEKGLSLATRPKAIVSAPCDGYIAFSGPYRSYGQLLIINAGGGYYVVLAGMDRINVNVGQFVLAGEPVAVMGDGIRENGGGHRDRREAAHSLC